jgi:hypothetical protein
MTSGVATQSARGVGERSRMMECGKEGLATMLTGAERTASEPEKMANGERQSRASISGWRQLYRFLKFPLAR